MNILFLSTEIPYPPNGGHHLRTFNILKLLSENHKIFFIGFVKERKKIECIEGIKQFCESVDVFLIRNSGARFFYKIVENLFSPLPYTATKYFIRNVGKRIQVIFSKAKIDLVHLDILPMSIYLPFLNSVPTILTDHNVESLRLYRWMKVEKNFLIKLFLYYQFFKLRNFERTVCSKVDLCISVSPSDCKILKNLCKTDNFAVIPNGVDIQYFRPTSLPIVENRLIWVGGMSGPYNADAVNYFLEEILPLIQKKYPHVEVDFVGGHPTKKLKQSAQENPRIRMHGFVDDIRPYVQKAAIFIAPIRSGSGTKIKVLNAMALAKPVVTTSIGAEGICAEPNVDIMIADTPGEFAEKTIYLLKNPDIAKQMGRAGQAVVKKYYDWSIIGEKMEQLYQKIGHRF